MSASKLELWGALAGVRVAGLDVYAMGADDTEPAIALVDGAYRFDIDLTEAESLAKEITRLVKVARNAARLPLIRAISPGVPLSLGR